MKKNNLERNLRRQLKQAEFSVDEVPTSFDEWQSFLQSINRSYVGNKETRYLLEKSLDESSQEMRKLYNDLKKETEERVKALQESKEKTRFMANMSHEIRTPIHGILGSLEIVKNSTALDDKQKAFIGTAFTSAENLLDIINNILDFSKISVDQLEVESISFDIHTLIEEANSLASISATDKNLNISCFIEKNVPARLKGDPIKVRQVLTNLLNNAVKFTHKGEVSTRVNLLQSTNNLAKVRIEVSDTGVGIPKAMQQNIFDAFIQEDVSTTRQYGGTGLGLTIIKELIELMGGQVDMESQKGKGSRFWVDIPFEITEKSSTNVANNGLAGLHILAVDDVKANLSIIEHYLSEWGVEADLATSGSEALSCLKQTYTAGLQYDIIIVDWFMPGMDGLKFSQALNNEPDYKNIPKIMLSSHAVGRNKRMQANLSITLTKPIRKSMLKDVLLECINEHQKKNKEESLKNKYLHEDDDELFELHDGYLKLIPDTTDILLAEDNEVNALIAITMMEQIGLSVKHVTDGEQAVNELKNGRYKSILMDMHMPVMDGYEATRKIREWELATKTTATPIIALTANALIGDKEKCLATGMDDYLPKPVRQDRLKEVVSKWVDREVVTSS